MTRVVVTRASHQAGELRKALEESGYEVLELPVIEILGPEDADPVLQNAFDRLDEYDWLVVTSVNTVEHISQFLKGERGSVQVAAIGVATADALHAIGIEVDLIPEHYVAESLVDAFPDGKGKVLLPNVAGARNILPEGLRAKGWQVDVITAYTTVAAKPTPAAAEELARADVITFTSSSTVENFIDAYGLTHVPPLVACIGPVTATTAGALGLKVNAVAAQHTIPGLIRALSSL